MNVSFQNHSLLLLIIQNSFYRDPFRLLKVVPVKTSVRDWDGSEKICFPVILVNQPFKMFFPPLNVTVKQLVANIFLHK